MNLYLLDAGGAGLVFVGFMILGLFMIIAILVEAFIMLVMKYNRGFKKRFVDSLIINLASLAVGFLLIEVGGDYFDGFITTSLILLFGITLVIETFLLYLLNKNHPFLRTIAVSLVMNVVTYGILLLIGK